MKRCFFVVLTLLLIGGVAWSQCVVSSHVVSTPVVKKVVAVTPVVEKVIVKEVVPLYTPVAVFAPYAAVVPAYGGAYVPPAAYPALPPTPPAPQAAPAPTPPQTSHSEMKQVLEILQKMDSRITALEKSPPMVSPTTPTPVAPMHTQPQPNLPPTPTRPQTAPGTGTPGTGTPGAGASVSASGVLQTKCVSCHETKNAAEKGGGFVLFDGVNLQKPDNLALRKLITQVYSGKMPPRTSGIQSLTDEEVGVVVAWVDSIK